MKQNLKQELLKRSHNLKPVVIIGNKGLTEAVQQEIEQALAHHELIKIKFLENDRDMIAELSQQIVTKAEAELILKIGKTVTIYRAKD